jgi:DNA-binding NarL/FixJ family response regulator
MTPNAAMAHLRRLACIGVDAGAAMPDALELITHVVPSANNVFVPTDESFTCRSIVCRHWGPSVLENLFAKRQSEYREICDAHEQWWRTAPTSISVDENAMAYAGLQRTTLYFECLRPFGQHHVLEGFVRQGHRPRGYLSLFRDASSRRFSHRDVRRLQTLLPYLAVLMADSARPGMEYAPPATGAVVIVDARGMVQSLSQGGRNVLHQALNPGSDTHADVSDALAIVTKRLLRQLRASMSDAVGRECSPPIVEVRNGRGLFTFRAHWLMGEEDRTHAHVCIIVNHAEPLALRLMRGLATLPLSPAQKSVALLLVRAQSRKAIAQELGVSDETVKDLVRLVYHKLGVHDRHQLLASLLEAGVSRH